MGTVNMTRRGAFALSPVAAGCAALLMAAGGASAQQVPQAQPEAQQPEPARTNANGQATDGQKAKGAEGHNAAATDSGQGASVIVVTGIRKGIEDAISVKKNSDNVVEAISAEDIGKLPDNSIAESIARLPGLSAQRVGGVAQEISIRGMSGDFSTTLLNGREQASTGDNRSAQFDSYPSELMTGVVVYKTFDASLVGQGLSGTVDLQTARPLSFGKRAVVIGARKERDAVGAPSGKGDGKRFSFSYIDQFAERTLGVSFGIARNEATSHSTLRQGDYSSVTVNGQSVLAPTHWKMFGNDKHETKTGAMGTLEWKPSNDLRSTVDVFYSKTDSDTNRKGIEATTTGTWTGGCNPGCVLQNPTVVNGYVDSGQWTGVNHVLANDVDTNSAELKSFGWNTSLKLSEGWKAEQDVSVSTATRKESPYESWAGVPGGANDTVAFSGAAGGLNSLVLQPSVHYDDPSIVKLTNAGGWGGPWPTGLDGYLKKLEVDDDLKSYKLKAEHLMPEGSPFSKLDFGIDLASRKKQRTVPEWQLHLKDGPAVDVPNPGSVVAGDSGVPMISYDALAAGSLYNQVLYTYWDINLKDWVVNERAATAYAKLDLDTSVGGIPLRGNLGLQAVDTDQSSTGRQVDMSVGTDTTHPVVPYTVGTHYTDVLPSMNLIFDLGHDQSLRFSVARTMARPRMDQLSASNTASVDATAPGGPQWSGSGGNPRLQPWRANAVDLGYEKYFGNKGYVSAAVFYKDLLSYIYTYNNTHFDFTGFQNNGGIVPISNFGTFSQPQNGTGGKLSGIELTASVPLELIAQPLQGFGVEASVSLSHSTIKPFGNNDTSTLPGLSKQVANLIAYYERYGFSARVATRYRSDFLGEITGYASNRYFQYIKSEAITDLQLGYEFEAGPAKGLTMLFQINNLTDAKYQEYKDTPSNVTNVVKYGKSLLLGATYKF